MKRGGMRAREAQKAGLLGRQYEQLQEIWAENAMLFHDMENHLQTIRYLAEEGKNEEISAYIAKISHPMERLSGILWTGIGIVDAVLNEKRRLAAEVGWRLDINAQLPGERELPGSLPGYSQGGLWAHGFGRQRKRRQTNGKEKTG